MNNSVAIIAVNENQEIFNKKLLDYLCSELSKYDIEVVNDYEENNIKTMIEDATNRTNIFIIVSDAVRGKNPFFSFAAKELYKKKIKPIVLVTNIDKPESDLDMAASILEEVWLLEEPNLESWNLNFDTVYFSFERKVSYISPENETDGILALIEIINDYEN